jgi:hypothetical protein
MRLIAAAACLVVVAYPGDAAPQEHAKDSKAIEGLWSGFWGGGAADGVVFQPVIAELFIKGDHAELHGFRNVGRLAGTVRLDAGAKRLRITPAAEAGGLPAPKAVEYAYEIKADTLTLTDADKFSVSLKRHRVAQDPLANAQVDLVAATGINDAGDLLVTEFTALRAGRAGATYFQPENRSLKTRQATVLLVQDTGCKEVTVDEARRLIRPSTPVAVTYRDDDRPRPPQLHELWKEMGPPAPDSEAVGQTFSRLLRPGTLVFILSARENVPVP